MTSRRNKLPSNSHDDQDDFGESLPSNSVLQHISNDGDIAVGVGSSRYSTPRHSLSDFQPTSPPPPPPPPPVAKIFNASLGKSGNFSVSDEGSMMSQKRNGGANSNPTSSKSVAPRPFLKKGSRQEPSALQKRSPSSSPTNVDSLPSFSNTSSPTNFGTNTNNSGSSNNFSNGKVKFDAYESPSGLGSTLSPFEAKTIANELQNRLKREKAELNEFEKLEKIVADSEMMPEKKGGFGMDLSGMYENIKTFANEEDYGTEEEPDADADENDDGYYGNNKFSSSRGFNSSKVEVTNRSNKVENFRENQHRQHIPSSTNLPLKSSQDNNRVASKHGNNEPSSPIDEKLLVGSSSSSSSQRWGAVTRPAANDDESGNDEEVDERHASGGNYSYDNSNDDGNDDDDDDFYSYGHKNEHKNRSNGSKNNYDQLEGGSEFVGFSHKEDQYSYNKIGSSTMYADSGAYNNDVSDRLIKSGRLSPEGQQNKMKNNNSSENFLAMRPSPGGGNTAASSGPNRNQGVKNNSNNSNNNSNTPSSNSKSQKKNGDIDIDSLKKDLAAKAKELEEELKTYREENALLKSQRKQVELSFSEALQSRSDVLKWVAEERVKTEKWCEEQRNSALKEKRAAAKYARDIRSRSSTDNTSGFMSVRKEKAEIEGMMATIEKYKVDLDTSNKKSKMALKRLQDIVKEQQITLSDNEKQIQLLEKDKIALWSFLDRSGVKPPNSIRNARYENLSKAALESLGESPASISTLKSNKAAAHPSVRKGSTAASSFSRSGGVLVVGDGTIVEEVDIEDFSGPMIAAKVTSTHHLSDANHDYISSPSRNIAAAATSSSSSSSLLNYDPLRYQSLKSNAGEVTMVTDFADELMNRDDLLLSSSWQRSSRTSVSRYSDDVGGDNDDYVDDDDDGGGGGGANNYGDDGDVDVNNNIIDDDIVGNKATRNKDRGKNVSRDESISNKFQNHPYSNTNERDFADILAVDGRSKGSPYQGNRIVDDLSSGFTRKNIKNETMLSNNSNSVATTFAITDTSEFHPKNASSSGGKSEKMLEDGSLFINYKNGTVKRVFADGSHIIKFVNGDIKKSDIKTGIKEYYYAEAKTTHTTYPDGRQVYQFPNGQVENHFANGKKEIQFPDSTRKVIHPDGVQECHFPDGPRYREYPDGNTQ